MAESENACFLAGLTVAEDDLATDPEGCRARLLNLDRPVYAAVRNGNTLLADQARWSESAAQGSLPCLAGAPAVPVSALGDAGFREEYGVKASFYAGAMANAIASEEMVVTLGRAGYLSSFGAAGLSPGRVEAAIRTIQEALPNGPYASNLIHSPGEPALERAVVDLYLKHGVTVVEAAAFMALTENVVRYRVAGLTELPDGTVKAQNRIIAKVSRREVARHFLAPAPEKLLKKLLESGQISEAQAALARRVPMADDITVEADSGGHTDNRPLTAIFPSIAALRDEIGEREGYGPIVRVGAAGGIGTPEAALAAFCMGAAYVVTGSVNQACRESGASDHTKKLLAQADMADVIMAPAADMFEMGVQVQVLKRGTLFAMRAKKLYELYNSCACLEDIPPKDREKVENQFFKKSLEEVWEETRAFFAKRDPEHLEKWEQNPKKKMALVFRWYLGLSSRWSNEGLAGREMDYQIWCGAAMGAFNAWTAGTYLEAPENRSVVDAAHHILFGAAYLNRVRALEVQGAGLPRALSRYTPKPLAG